MNKLTTVLITGLAAPLALIAASTLPVIGTGCGSGGSSGSSTGGTTGKDGGGGTGNTFPLPSSATGFVDDPTTMVIGAWFAYGDSVGSNASTTSTDIMDSDCVKKGMFPQSACSVINTPTPGMPFMPTDAASSKMCTSGTAAQVMNMAGNPDYTDLWGAGIGLDFNNPGGDAGVAGYADLSAYSGIEFDFSADVLPTGDMRVNFPFKTMHGTDSPFWGGASMAASNLTGTTASPQHVKITWDMIGGPYYLTQQTPPVDVTMYPFDAKNVSAIQFQVFTNTKTSTPYSFCVANLALFK